MINILVIDDNESFLELIGERLIIEGYRVEEATSGNDGVRRCFKEQFDLVITDVFMPDKDGLEVIKDVLKQDPLLKIIVMSSKPESSGVDVEHFTKKLGARGFLSKPFRMGELIETVESLVGKPELRVTEAKGHDPRLRHLNRDCRVVERMVPEFGCS